MSDLLSARLQMAISLAFHIIFAVVGMAMPLFMAIAEALHLRTKDPVYADLARRWAKGTAIIFAVGAVSGTVLSFELGLLWPRFMEHAGPVIGMPFSLEGFAFFVEAIFIGVYLYGWDRIPGWAHLASGLVVAAAGIASGIFVVAVNAWMNTPSGVTFEGGHIGQIDLVAAFFSPAFFTQALHMVLAAIASVAIAVLGVHAWRLRADPSSRFHVAAVKIALALAIVSVPLQLVSGDMAAKQIARNQPIKFAASESLFETQTAAPLAIGGWPDVEARRLRGAIEVPYALSFLATADPKSRVRGLEEFPRSEWPPIPMVHVAFQVMVLAGGAMFLVVGWGALLWGLRRAFFRERRFLTAAALATPLGFIAVEAGWTVTEVGRQPWVVSGFLRTADAVTPMPGLVVPFVLFTLLYAVLGVVVLTMLRAHVFSEGASADG
jgi:cytochrome d ubiquinol oxidase subunit I